MMFIRYLCVKIVQNTNMLVNHCAFMHMFFRKRPGCLFIGACALTGTKHGK